MLMSSREKTKVDMKNKGYAVVAALLIVLLCVAGFAACVTHGDGEEDEIKYTVTFETNGGTPCPATTVQKGASVTLPDPVREGYTFAGWYTDAEFSGQRLTSPYVPTSDATLYAKWTKDDSGDNEDDKPAQKVTVAFVSNGGPAVTAIVTDKGSAVTLPELEREGYTFEGWYTDAEFSGRRLTSPYVPDADATLYAKWLQVSDNKYFAFTPLETGGFSVSKSQEETFPEEIFLPSAYQGQPVRAIADNAFKNCADVKRVSIPDSVTSIGNYAFYNCSALNDVVMPDSVETIGNYAFAACSALDNISLGNGVREIGKFAFYSCSALQNVTIPDRVETIGSQAFQSCEALTAVSVGKGVTNIGAYAFYQCGSLASISVDGANQTYRGIGNCLIETASKTLIAGCNGSVIPNDGSVTKIGDYAFYGYEGLKAAAIPSGVTDIGNKAFYNCASLSELTLAVGVSAIGELAFGGCNMLMSVKIPSSVEKIGANAFKYCRALTIYAQAADTPTGWNGDWNANRLPVVWDCDRNATATDGYVYAVVDNVRYGIKNDQACVQQQPGTIQTLDVPSAIVVNGTRYPVTQIGAQACFENASLTRVSIPSSVTKIGANAFEGCKFLTEIGIPVGVTLIDSGAFSRCTSLATINFNGTVAQWAKIKKYSGWNDKTGEYTVKCTDGETK